MVEGGWSTTAAPKNLSRARAAANEPDTRRAQQKSGRWERSVRGTVRFAFFQTHPILRQCGRSTGGAGQVSPGDRACCRYRRRQRGCGGGGAGRPQLRLDSIPSRAAGKRARPTASTTKIRSLGAVGARNCTICLLSDPSYPPTMSAQHRRSRSGKPRRQGVLPIPPEAARLWWRGGLVDRSCA